MAGEKPTGTATRRRKGTTEAQNAGCELCGGKLEPIANRRFLLYKRAQLPQPQPDACMCNVCGAVYNDRIFEAAVQARAVQLVSDN